MLLLYYRGKSPHTVETQKCLLCLYLYIYEYDESKYFAGTTLNNVFGENEIYSRNEDSCLHLW